MPEYGHDCIFEKAGFIYAVDKGVIEEMQAAARDGQVELYDDDGKLVAPEDADENTHVKLTEKGRREMKAHA